MSSPLLLGIEIGGTKLQLGLGRGDGRIVALERRTVDASRGGEGIRLQILDAFNELLHQTSFERTKIEAVGIGFGGPVAPERGVVLTSNQIEGWTEFPIVEWAREALGISRVALENDADSAALGEARLGAGAGFSPVLYVTIGSGIGGGLIVNNAIYRGSGAGAVEIGHLVIETDEGPTAQRTLEQIASGWSIGRAGSDLVRYSQGSILSQLAAGNPERVTAAMVSEAARQGDSGALSILGDATTAFGRALAHAVTLLAPARVILGGGVSLIGETLWFEPVRRETDRRVYTAFRGRYEIVPAGLHEEVVIHGALAVARDHLSERLRESTP